jgi:hypothetical protein
MSTFDSFVKPECNIWDQRCIDVHQIHPNNNKIVTADNIDNVWSQFKIWLNGHVGVGETVILVA